MPVVTHVLCCDYHAGPRDDPYHRRQSYSWHYEGKPSAAIEVPRRLESLYLYLPDAVTHDHDCEDAGCDIAAAMANGYTFVAYHLLTGATSEAHACDALVGALEKVHGLERVREKIGADLYTCPGWEDWQRYHATYARGCESCGGYTYAEHGWEPESCAHCGEEYPHPFAGDNRANLPDVVGGVALFAITDDGESLCEACVTDPTNPVHDVRERPDVWHDGWSVVAFDTTGNVDDAGYCAHCGEHIGPEPEPEPATYDSASARVLRDNVSGQTVWSPERGWHDGGDA